MISISHNDKKVCIISESQKGDTELVFADSVEDFIDNFEVVDESLYLSTVYAAIINGEFISFSNMGHSNSYYHDLLAFMIQNYLDPISKEKIRQAIDRHIITFVHENNHTEYKIRDIPVGTKDWPTKRKPEVYFKRAKLEKIINDIYDILEFYRTSPEEFHTHYLYFRACLNNQTIRHYFDKNGVEITPNCKIRYPDGTVCRVYLKQDSSIGAGLERESEYNEDSSFPAALHLRPLTTTETYNVEVVPEETPLSDYSNNPV